jgi:hypothetical protein
VQRKLFQEKFDQKPIATAGSSDATLAAQRFRLKKNNLSAPIFTFQAPVFTIFMFLV